MAGKGLEGQLNNHNNCLMDLYNRVEKLEHQNAERENVQVGAMVRDVCEWKADEDGVYNTDCKNMFYFDTGGVADNKGKFCFYCGKLIKEIEYNGSMTIGTNKIK